ncbi:MAG: type I methionyl aminopeptidase [Clostridiales bacterium]|jgi:methionyl aminopeptidase|nr:type I methionyl aminopeptidase [Clostridiales bacterium]
MIPVKSAADLACMREACALTGEVLDHVEALVAPGVTTEELDRAVESFIRKRGATPSFKGYNGFPKSACISVNEEVIHGIPGGKRLQRGDIVSVDVGAYLKGFHGDAARTFPVGEADAASLRLIAVTRACFYAGLAAVKAGARLGDVSGAVQRTAEDAGFSVVREYVGHGVGRELHEDPEVPNVGTPGRGTRLYEGMTLAIEPMINAGGRAIRVLPNNWTVVTQDGKRSAHYENTVLVTQSGGEILTATAKP